MNYAVAVLLFVTLVWGTTFPLLKSASATLSGVEMSAARFVVAAMVMLPFVLKARRETWRDGALLGALALTSYVAQAFGLEHISSNRSAFLTSLNVLMVPFLGLLFGGRISAVMLGAAALACAGIGLMSWEGGGNWLGDGATVICALAYALYTIVLSQRAGKHEARQLAATQIIFMAVFGVLWVLGKAAFDGGTALGTLPERLMPQWWIIVYLGLIATAGMLMLQAWAQRSVSADKAAVIYAMEPVFAALFGWVLLSESLTIRAGLGGALVVVAVILSELKPAVGKSPA
ncbi:DMT family transporter [Chitinimonas sp. BJYL2]|uniref:DMT family transporter n=1 Tax=Chitinimonas sp. BJYL2 TaxID=2976696 RepID=UPI0022B5BCD6|nr:DMT family transporter [Chitinimonas sp. BJYL2]